MEPMKPMKEMEPWWPDRLGKPSTAGSQNDLRYAYFPDSQRLAVSRGGKVTVYDSGNHKISGVSQQQGGDRGDVTFSSQDGEVALSDLKVVSYGGP
jgi:hypothetical protein